MPPYLVMMRIPVTAESKRVEAGGAPVPIMIEDSVVINLSAYHHGPTVDAPFEGYYAIKQR